jgi:hypothetical protein
MAIIPNVKLTDTHLPIYLINQLPVEFDLDVCATSSTKAAYHYFNSSYEAFISDWTGNVWCFPATDRIALKWLKYAERQAKQTYCTTIYCMVTQSLAVKFKDKATIRPIKYNPPMVHGDERNAQGRRIRTKMALVIFDKTVKPQTIPFSWVICDDPLQCNTCNTTKTPQHFQHSPRNTVRKGRGVVCISCMGFKTCLTCNVSKNTKDFYIGKTNGDYKTSSNCKSCTSKLKSKKENHIYKPRRQEVIKSQNHQTYSQFKCHFDKHMKDHKSMRVFDPISGQALYIESMPDIKTFYAKMIKIKLLYNLPPKNGKPVLAITENGKHYGFMNYKTIKWYTETFYHLIVFQF